MAPVLLPEYTRRAVRAPSVSPFHRHRHRIRPRPHSNRRLNPMNAAAFGLYLPPTKTPPKTPPPPKRQSPHLETYFQLFSAMSYSLLPKHLLTSRASPRAPFCPVPPYPSATLKSRRGSALPHSSRRPRAKIALARRQAVPVYKWCWVSFGEQSRVISRECRSSFQCSLL